MDMMERQNTIGFDAEELQLAAAQKSRLHTLQTLSPQALREKRVVTLQSLWRGRCVRQGPLRKRLKMNRHRNKVVREILSTEESYNESLKFVIDYVKKQLEFHSTGPQAIITEAQLSTLFSNVEQIYILSNQIIDIIGPIVSEWDAHGTIGDAFLRIVPFLKIYNIYCNNYDQAQELLGILEKDPKLAQFWEAFRKVSTKGTLASYLIMPVQRVPRYVLLFRDLIKSTWEDHSDFANLQQCMQKCEEIAGSINQNMRELATANKDMLDAYTYFAAFVPVLSPTRRFIRRDPIRLLRQDRTVEFVWLWLFNDLMIISYKMGEESYTYEAHAFLKDGRNTSVIVQELPAGLSLAAFGFSVVATNGAYTFTCVDQIEQQEWLADFRRELGSMEDVFMASVKGVAVRMDAKKRQYATYIIELRQGEGQNIRTHNVNHRYSEFDQLRKQLARRFPTVVVPKLPPKRFFNHDSREIDNRIVALGNFLQECCLRPELRSCSLLREFLELSPAGIPSRDSREHSQGSRSASELSLSPRHTLQRGDSASEAEFFMRYSGAKGKNKDPDAMVRVRVEVPEGPAMEVKMNRHTRAGDVVEALCYELKLTPSIGFALFVDCNENRADSVIGNADYASGAGASSSVDLLTFPPSITGGLPGELGLEALPLEAHEFPLRVLHDTRRRGAGRARLVIQRMFMFADDEGFFVRPETAPTIAFIGGQCWRDIRFGALEGSVNTSLSAAAGFALAKYGVYTPDKGPTFVADYEVVPPKYVKKLRPPEREVGISTAMLGSADLRFYALDTSPNYKDRRYVMQVWSTDPQLAPLMMQASNEADYERWRKALSRACTTTAPLNDAAGRAAIGKTLRNRNRIMRQEGEGENVLLEKIKSYICGNIAASASGWMTKKARNGTFRHNWKERWFMLLGSTIFYFKEPVEMQLSREFWHQSVTRRWEDLGNMTAGEAWAHVIMTCRDARVFGGIKFRVGVAHNKLPNRAQMLLYVRERGIVLTDLADRLDVSSANGETPTNVVRTAYIDIPYHAIDHVQTVCSTDSITIMIVGVVGELSGQHICFATPHGYDIKRLMEQYRNASIEIAKKRNAAGDEFQQNEPPLVSSPVEVTPRSFRDPAAYRRGLEATATASRRFGKHAYLNRPPTLSTSMSTEEEVQMSPVMRQAMTEQLHRSPSPRGGIAPPKKLSQAYRSPRSSPRGAVGPASPPPPARNPLDRMPAPAAVQQFQPPPPPGPKQPASFQPPPPPGPSPRERKRSSITYPG